MLLNRTVLEDRVESAATTLTMTKYPTVMVIDDEPAILEMLEMLLEEEYTVNTCPNPVIAMQEISRLQPDLIIADFMMPQLTGVELLRTVRRNVNLAQVPVILMTASTNLNACGLTEAELKNLNAFLVKKPFDNNRLLQLMQDLIAHQIS